MTKSSSQPNSYPPEVWQALRTLWEAAPKITWIDLVDQVRDMLAMPTPDASVVARKAKREGWTKTTIKAGQQARQKARKTDRNRHAKSTTSDHPDDPDSENEKIESNQSGKLVVTGREGGQSTSHSDQMDVDISAIVRHAQNSIDMQAEVIAKHRSRNYNMGLIADQILQNWPPVPDRNAPDEIKQEYDYQIANAAKQATVLDLITKSNERMAKTEFEVWGISEDMFRAEQARRKTANIEKLEALAAEDEQRLLRERADMQDRQRRLIEQDDAGQRGTTIDHEPTRPAKPEHAADGAEAGGDQG